MESDLTHARARQAGPESVDLPHKLREAARIEFVKHLLGPGETVRGQSCYGETSVSRLRALTQDVQVRVKRGRFRKWVIEFNFAKTRSPSFLKGNLRKGQVTRSKGLGLRDANEILEKILTTFQPEGCPAPDFRKRLHFHWGRL